MSLRYPAAEILTGAILVYVFQRLGVGSTGLALAFYLVLFELIAVIDVEHRYILNVVMFPAFVVALVEVAFSGRISLREGLVGYAVGQIALMMVFALGGLYGAIVNRGHQVTNEVAFGFGDVTLATFCGLVVGYPNVVYMLILMVLIGGLIAGGYMVGHIIIARRYQAHMPVAYGPAIVLSAAAMLLWREPIMALIYGPH